jgi:hypothetical protein
MVKKILKFNLTILSLLIGVMVVNAEECTAPIVDNNNQANRTLQCDATRQTVTKFKSTTTSTQKLNDLCTITCSEDIVLGIDPIKNVRAGMGFNYPLYISAQRKCTATYDFKKFDTDLRSLVTQRNSQTAGSNAYQTTVNAISNMLQQKSECDKWGDPSGANPQGVYKINPDIHIDIETSERVISIPYVYKESEPYKRVIENEIEPYSSCDLKDNARANCTENRQTISGWTEIASINGRYTMKDVYIELYSGKVVDAPVEVDGVSKTCLAKDAYFTSFYELTRPLDGDTTDRGYKLNLIVRNIGNNINATGDVWNLNVDCWYTVKNMLFPQGGGTTTDQNYNKYGSTAFMYRIIDLNDPFPNNRKPGENWYGKEHLITNTKDELRKKMLYTIELNSSSIERIRQYNLHNSYTTFDLGQMEKSKFIEANKDIIDTNREISNKKYK